MLLVIGQYYSSFLASLKESNEAFEIVKDAKRYSDAEAIDFTNEQTVLDYVSTMKPRPTVAVALYEQYVPICAKINEILNHHSLSYESAMRCTDKVLMRKALSSFDGISPNYEEVVGFEKADAFARKYGFPVILKPANLSKSMLVMKCETTEELDAAMQQIESDAPRLYQKYTLGEKPKFIIEEFMEGTIHTVAAFADADGTITCAPGVVDNISATDIGYDDSFIYSRLLPGRLSDELQNQIFACAKKGMQALGMRSSAGHVEIILTEEGPRIIEIGARLGGYRPRMYKAVYGIDLIQQSIRVARGEKVLLDGGQVSNCSVFELFPKTVGAFVEVSGLKDIDQSSFNYFSIKPNPGDIVGTAKRGYKATVVIIVESVDADEFEGLCRSVDQLRIKVSAA